MAKSYNLKTDSLHLHGRTVLYTAYERVDKSNILQVLEDIMPMYLFNKSQTEYLQNYRRGEQPILNRVKKVRDDIKNITIVNFADEIVNFKTGYLLGEPIQYVLRNTDTDESVSNSLNRFNNYCYINNKSELDIELAEDMYTTGTAYRMVLPNKEQKKSAKLYVPPFKIYSLNPSECGIVYSTALGNKPLLSVLEVLVKNADGTSLIPKYCCYTDTEYFEVLEGKIVRNEEHDLGAIPMIEYPLNKQRLGAFEVVITLLDAINRIESNRVDAIEQTVQALMVFYNLGMDTESLEKLKKYGAISLTANSKSGTQQDVKYLSCDLDQQQTQTLIDCLYKDILNICGMPNRNGGYSTSDTGSAVIMRDGWSDAEARAKGDELMFRKSEMEFLKLALSLSSRMSKEEQNLAIYNIDIRFTRRNYENITSKTNVLTSMLSSDWIDPELAFQVCGVFTDPELAFQKSKEYHESVVPTEVEEDKTTNILVDDKA